MTTNVSGRVSVLALSLLLCTSLSVGSETEVNSTMDGVFGYRQALNGKTLYGETCAACHRSDMSGDERTAPLVGPSFWSRWGNHSLAELFSRIKNTMPADQRIGTLDDEVVADILAYILLANDVPSAKDATLRSDMGELENIRIIGR